MRALNILIGPINNDPSESVSNVNKSIIRGLSAGFLFVAHSANRAYGASGQGRLNVLNGFYLLKHAATWLWALVLYRPAVAHYAITADWNLEKSLLFLKVGSLLGAKTLGHLHGGSFLSDWAILPNWRKEWALRILPKLDGMVVLSEGWREAIAQEIGLDRKQIHVVNNPIDVDFEREAVMMPVPRDSKKVLCMGVLDRKKGVFDILEAANTFADYEIEFQLVGPEREPGILNELINAIRKSGLSNRVKILGAVFSEKKSSLFQQAAVFLLPSYAENFPLVVLEAAAAGLPIISTRVGATPEFFEHGVSALFIDTGSPLQIAEAVRSLLDSSTRRSELGLAARQVFTSRLQREHIMKSMARVYDSVAGRSDSAADEVSAPAGVVRAATPEAPLQGS